MKKSINLYSDSLKPVKYWLTLKNVAMASLLVATTTLAWFGKGYLDLQELARDTKRISQEVDFARQELKNYEQALLAHNDTAAFNKQKLKLEKTVQVKATLLASVANRTTEKSINYYQVMRDLTEHHDHDIWLTSFIFNEDNVEFNGYALQSKSVTNWMTYLQASDSFKGKELSHLNISALDAEVLQFRAATKITETLDKVVK